MGVLTPHAGALLSVLNLQCWLLPLIPDTDMEGHRTRASASGRAVAPARGCTLTPEPRPWYLTGGLAGLAQGRTMAEGGYLGLFQSPQWNP